MDEVEKLIQQLKDPNPQTRWEAARTLSWMSDARSVEPLIGALKDGDWMVRKDVAQALCRIADKLDIDLVGVRASLLEFVDKVEDPDKQANAKQWAAYSYAQIAAAVAERKKMSGELLAAKIPKPRGKKGVYRKMRRAVV